MDSLTAHETSPRSGERRQHLRQRVSSIIPVKLADSNGGILLDLGAGGLSFQAVYELNPEQEVVLQFGLSDAKETSTIQGTVAWLSPSRKQAGIRFSEVPESTKESIAKWITGEAGTRAMEWAEKLPAKPQAVADEPKTSLPPAHLEPSPTIPQLPPTNSSTVSEKTTTGRDRPDSPARNSLIEAASEDKWTKWTSAIQTFFLQRSNRRRLALIGAGLAACFVVALLTVMTMRFGKRSTSNLSRSTPAPAPFASRAATGAAGASSSSPVATSPPQPRAVQDSQGLPAAQWLANLMTRLPGAADRGALDPTAYRVYVWVVSRNGFYYCADSPYFKTLRPGKLVTQGSALQSGYQPKLGSYCR